MKPVALHPEAEDELKDSVLFYEQAGGIELALHFQASVRNALTLIAADPGRFPRMRRFSRVQKYLIHRFPFFIYFIEREREIWIVAIAHTRRRPNYWRRRIP